MSKYIRFGNAAKSVRDIDRQTSAEIKKMYNDLLKETKKKVKAIENKKALTNNITNTEYLNLIQLKDLEESIESSLQEIDDRLNNMIGKKMLAASKAVTADGTAWLNEIGVGVKVAYAKVPTDVVSNIMSGELYRDSNGRPWSFSGAIWGHYNKAKGELSKIVAEGIAANKSAKEIAQDLEKYVNPNLAKASRKILRPIYKKNADGTFARDKNGNRIPTGKYNKFYFGRVDYNAQRLARTMIQHAYEQSLIQVSKTNPYVKGIKWIAGHDCCPLCADRADSDSYGLGAGVFPVDSVPLDHPNGKCTFITVMYEDSEKINEHLWAWARGEIEDEQLEAFAYSVGFDKKDIK